MIPAMGLADESPVASKPSPCVEVTGTVEETRGDDAGLTEVVEVLRVLKPPDWTRTSAAVNVSPR
jgi:hypothetical protein